MDSSITISCINDSDMNYYVILSNPKTYPRAKRSSRADEIGKCGIVEAANEECIKHKSRVQS